MRRQITRSLLNKLLIKITIIFKSVSRQKKRQSFSTRNRGQMVCALQFLNNGKQHYIFKHIYVHYYKSI